MRSCIANAAAAACLIALGGAELSAQDLLLQPVDDEALLGPITVSETVQGIPLSLRVSAFVSLNDPADGAQLVARIVADLSDVQQKIGALVDTIPLPGNACDHFGGDNLVAGIWGKRLTIDDSGTATLTLDGDVNVFGCTTNPVPCTRIEWDQTTVFGAIVRTPRVVAFDCNPPIQAQIVNQPFTATLPFTLHATDPLTIAVALGTPAVNLGGALGGVTDSILNIAGVDINSRASAFLNNAIRPEVLERSLPDEVLQLSPTITSAELLSNGGRLAASIEIVVAVNGQDLAGLVTLLQALSQEPPAS